MRHTYTIINGFEPGAALGWDGTETVSARDFCATAVALAAALPPKRYVINLCEDRLNFSLGLTAALLARQVSLLPPSRAPEVVREILATHPESYCLADHSDLPVGVPAQMIPPWKKADAAQSVPEIPATRIAAILFTSGSTGGPQPHAKTWGSLVEGARNLARELSIPRASALLGTVPPQHMYGLETTVMLPLQNGMGMHSGRPLLAADAAAALSTLPARPCPWIATTPAHLRAWTAESAPLVPLGGILSATMPLAPEIALAAEQLWSTPVHEIYGSTETGAVALRRTAQGGSWRARSGMRLYERNAETWMEGGHLIGPMKLPDFVELKNEGEFTLLGRPADMVKISGKRASLDALNRELQHIPGVADGAFFLPDNARGSARLSALVVTSTLDSRAILAALRKRIDPVFLPRPLLVVAALPRNATGKLPREGLLALAREARAQPRRSA